MLEQSLAHLLVNQSKALPNKPLYMEKENGTYVSYTFSEIHSKVISLSKAFLALGLQEKEKVAIISTNQIKWALFDYAALMSGLIDVPIYPTLLSNSIEYILINSESRVVFIQDRKQLEKIVDIDFSKTSLIKIVLLDDDVKESDHDLIVSYTDFISSGVAIPDADVELRLNNLNNEDVATIIYTSGTTGVPKGVMLSHKNILSNVEGATHVVPVDNNHVFLSFLPLSHIFERMFGHYLAMKYGATIAYAESIDTVAQNLQEIKPTIMAAVPRLYEKIYAKVLDAVEKGSPVKRKIFFWALSVGKEVVNNYTCYGKKPSGFLAFKHNLANKLVFNKLKGRVGGQVKFFISGGGALMGEIAEFFCSAGLIILEGYGLTETSPAITVNRPDRFKFGQVGPALPGVEVKIAEDGEILSRGPHIMKGYYKNEEATAEVFTEDGWFKTGDIGYLDNEGHLKITDRKKNIIVTSGGKNIAPLPIETALIGSKYIEQALVLGDKRKFCSAILVAAEEPLMDFAKLNGLTGSMMDLVKEEKVLELFQNEVERINRNLASYESIKKYILKGNPFTIESGELTPKLSIKRKEVLQNNSELIENLYTEAQKV